jgi:hypothetical protein
MNFFPFCCGVYSAHAQDALFLSDHYQCASAEVVGFLRLISNCVGMEGFDTCFDLEILQADNFLWSLGCIISESFAF